MPGPLLAGSPIRRPAGRRVCAPNRGLSQLAASFVGFPCQGIRRAPCISSHMSRSRSVSTGPRAGAGAESYRPGRNAPGAIVVSMSTAPSDRGPLSCGHVSQNRLDVFEMIPISLVPPPTSSGAARAGSRRPVSLCGSQGTRGYPGDRVPRESGGREDRAGPSPEVVSSDSRKRISLERR